MYEVKAYAVETVPKFHFLCFWRGSRRKKTQKRAHIVFLTGAPLLPGQLASGGNRKATACGNRNSKLHQKWQPLPMKAEKTP